MTDKKQFMTPQNNNKESHPTENTSILHVPYIYKGKEVTGLLYNFAYQFYDIMHDGKAMQLVDDIYNDDDLGLGISDAIAAVIIKMYTDSSGVLRIPEPATDDAVDRINKMSDKEMFNFIKDVKDETGK